MAELISKSSQRRLRDSLTYLVLLLGFLVISMALYRGGVHIASLRPEHITIRELPSALALSLLRMTASYVVCVIFAFALGLLAAKSETGERIILPILDILQSVPVTGFIPGAISFFIALASGRRIGVEMAACFLIFTSQAWNMAFAVYEATKTIPQDNLDAVASFGVRGSSRFWNLYAPAAVPRLVYNSILSWSNGWYFLVLCEIITVGPVQYHLPGIGSFLARASEQNQVHLIFWGLLGLTLLILALDMLIWRPATIWAERFRQDYSTSGETMIRGRRMFVSGLLPDDIFNQADFLVAGFRKLVTVFSFPLVFLFREILLPLFWDIPAEIGMRLSETVISRAVRWTSQIKWLKTLIAWIFGLGLGFVCGAVLIRWLRPPWPALAKEIPLALLASTARLVVTLGLSMALVFPIILWSWNRPRLRQTLSTIAQVGASIPAIALFPLILVIFIKKLNVGMEISTIVLLLTGMLWYVLFNGLGGAAIIPPDLGEAVRALGLKKRQTFKVLVIPAIRPALITGAITAWGGGWNALVVSEYVSFQGRTLTVNGIGSLLNRAVFQQGDNQSMSLCLVAMVAWVVIINLLVWRPLYRAAAERYRFDG